MIDLRLLGEVELKVADGHALNSVLAQPKRLALLAYLAMAGGYVRRDRLLGLFWPEMEAARARAALSKALHHLRGSLGADVLVGRGQEEIGLADGVLWCDAVAFREGAASGARERALELYRGDLLPGFFVADTPEFEQWLEAERGRLRESATAAALELAEAAQRAGDAARAEHWARRALDLDLCAEPAVRLLVSLLDAAGERAAAVRLYREWSERLNTTYGIAPAEETQALANGLRNRAVPQTAVPQPGSVPPAPGSSMAPVGGEVFRTLNRADAPPLRPEARPIATTRTRRWRTAVLALGVATVLTSAAWVLGRSDAPPHRILVVPLLNETGEPRLDPVGHMAGDWITQGLMQTGLVEVISRSDLLSQGATVSGNPALSGSDPALALARQLRAGTVVTGALYRTGNTIQLQARIVDGRTARVIESLAPVSVPAHAPLEGVEVLRQRVMAALATRTDARLRSWSEAVTRPPTYAAYREFVEGVELHAQGHYPEAIEHHMRAAALDSSFVQALVWAAKGHLGLGDHASAGGLGEQILAQRARLAPMDRLMADWILASVRGDQLGRLQAVREASVLLPGSELVLSQLGKDANALNRPQEALRVLRQLDPTRGYLRIHPGYWGDLTAAHHLLGEHQRELVRARDGGRQFPLRLSVLSSEIRALAALGRRETLLRRLEESLSFPAEPGSSPGRLMEIAALEATAHGHPELGRAVTRLALDWWRTLSAEERANGAMRLQDARLLYLAGELRAADSVFQAETAGGTMNLSHQVYLAALAARQGDTTRAEAIARSIGDLSLPYSFGENYYARARIAAQLGRHSEAVILLNEAFARGKRLDLDVHIAPHFGGLRAHPGFQDALRPRG